jgi:hypothetical protein
VTAGQRYTLALGLVVATFFLTVALPELYRSPATPTVPVGVAPAASASPTDSGASAPAPPATVAPAGGSRRVVRPAAPTAARALAVALAVLAAMVLLRGWIGSLLAVRASPPASEPT